MHTWNVKMRKMRKKNIRCICFLSVLLLCSSFLAGCGNDVIPAVDTQIRAEGYALAATGSSIGTKLLSKGICVIGKRQNVSTDTAITANAALLINDTKNKVLYAQDVYSTQYPASITKIATALMALRYSSLSEPVTISYNASHITEYGAVLCGFQEGDQITIKKLLYCLLVYSGNDAAVAIAEHISGTQQAFAEKMNREVMALGASDTHFVNSHGLHDDDHYTTAYDLYLIFHELLHYPIFRKIIRTTDRTVTWKSSQGQKRSLAISSTNLYLTGYAQAPEGLTVIGGKTGTTVSAGDCLILYSRNKKKQDLISVILHADSSYSLYQQMSYLLTTYS